MSINNPVGSISEAFPMLNRLEKALTNTYLEMSDDEIAKLHSEIQSVSTSNCSCTKYDIAKSMEKQVTAYYKRYIEK